MPSFYAFAAHRAAGRAGDRCARVRGRAHAPPRARASAGPRRPTPPTRSTTPSSIWPRWRRCARAPAQYLKKLPGRAVDVAARALDALAQAVEAGRRPVRRRDRQRCARSRTGLPQRAWSPSALQQYARCPYRFALRGIFGLRPAERPGGIQRMDPATRGRFYHEVQFELLRDLAAADAAGHRRESGATRWNGSTRCCPRRRSGAKRSSRPPSRRSGARRCRRFAPTCAAGCNRRRCYEADWTPQFYELSFGLKDPAGRDPRSRKEPVEIGGRLPAAGLDRPGGAARERRGAGGGSQDRPHPGAEARRWWAAAKCCSRRSTRWRRSRCWASRWRSAGSTIRPSRRITRRSMCR